VQFLQSATVELWDKLPYSDGGEIPLGILGIYVGIVATVFTSGKKIKDGLGQELKAGGSEHVQRTHIPVVKVERNG